MKRTKLQKARSERRRKERFFDEIEQRYLSAREDYEEARRAERMEEKRSERWIDDDEDDD